MIADRSDPGKKRKPRPAWWRIRLPAMPNVLALLVAQGEVTVVGMVAFDAWSHGDGPDAAAAVRTAQHKAHHARRELLTALQGALSSPVDQGDLYVLSERVDRILNLAGNAVRGADVLGWAPDARAAVCAGRKWPALAAALHRKGCLRQPGQC